MISFSHQLHELPGKINFSLGIGVSACQAGAEIAYNSDDHIDYDTDEETRLNLYWDPSGKLVTSCTGETLVLAADCKKSNPKIYLATTTSESPLEYGDYVCLNKTPKTQAQHQEEAKSHNGGLMRVTSLDLNTRLAIFLRDEMTNSVWINGNDRVQEGKFVYEESDHEELLFENLYNVNSINSENEDCIILRYRYDLDIGYWFTRYCDFKYTALYNVPNPIENDDEIVCEHIENLENSIGQRQVWFLDPTNNSIRNSECPNVQIETKNWLVSKTRRLHQIL